MKTYDVLAAPSPSKALGAASNGDPCDEYYAYRTVDVLLENLTPAAVKIWFVQVQDTSGQVPPGFSADTGTYVGVVDGAANSTHHSDPCRAGGRNQPIQGTLFKGSVKLVYRGKEYDYDLDDIAAEPGVFYDKTGWQLSTSQLMKVIPEMAPFSILPKKAPTRSE